MSEHTKRMLINVDDDETRIAIEAGSTLENLYIEQTHHDRIVGNIYRGVVVKVQTSFQAAFIDYGADRHGFLSLSDLNFSLFKSAQGKRGKVSIDKILKPGQSVMVQVTRNELGHKGASLTTNISLPGRFLVFMPNSDKGGVSKKIEDMETRTRLKHLLEGLCGEKDSAIIRTAGVNRGLSELKRDFMVLRRKWNQIQETFEDAATEGLIYQEEDAVVRTLRDYFNDDISEIWIDHAEAFQRSKEFFKACIPNYQKRLQFYLGDRSLFSAYGIEQQIEQLSSNHVPLPSGGSLVIDPTEALVAIDVNSGRYNQGNSIEETALKTNMESAEEVGRQLRLRNLGGLIVIDFIDMISEKHREMVVKKLEEHMQSDKAKWTIGEISQFGLLEMSRQRIASALSQETKTVCPTCGGMGMVLSLPSLANAVLRKIRELAATENISEISSRVPVELSNFLFNKKRQQLDELEVEFGIRIFLLADATAEGGQLPKFEVKTRNKNKQEGRTLLRELEKVGGDQGNETKERKKPRNSRKKTKPKAEEKPVEPVQAPEEAEVAPVEEKAEVKTEAKPVEVEAEAKAPKTEVVEEPEQPQESPVEEQETAEAKDEENAEESSPAGPPPIVPLYSSVHQPLPPNSKLPEIRTNKEERERNKAITPGTVMFSSTHRGDDSETFVNSGQTIVEFLENIKKSVDADDDAAEQESEAVSEVTEDSPVEEAEETSNSENVVEASEEVEEVKTRSVEQTEIKFEESEEAETAEAAAAPKPAAKKRAPRKTTGRPAAKKTAARKTTSTKKEAVAVEDVPEEEEAEAPVKKTRARKTTPRRTAKKPKAEASASAEESTVEEKPAPKKRSTAKRTTAKKPAVKAEAEEVAAETEEAAEPKAKAKPRAKTKAASNTRKTATRSTAARKSKAAEKSVSSEEQSEEEANAQPAKTAKAKATKAKNPRSKAKAKEEPVSEATAEEASTEEKAPAKKAPARKRTTKPRAPRTAAAKKQAEAKKEAEKITE